MADLEQLDENERLQYAEFRKKLNLQAAEAQAGKLEYNLTDVTLTDAMLRRACKEANDLKLGAICVLPCLVRPCAVLLGANPSTSLIACVSFPHGGDTLDSKTAIIKNAVRDGVDEIEVTAPLTYIKDGNWGYVRREFKVLKRAAKKRTLRINIECSLLTPQEINKVCTIAADCGITSLRSGSGAYGGGFDAQAVAAMKNAVKDRCTIKAEGITTFGEMQTAIDMGAGIVGSKNAPDIARIIKQVSE